MNNDEVYSPDGVPAGQIIRRPAAPDQASSANAEDCPGGAADHAGVANRSDIATVARSCEDLTNDRVTPGHSVVGDGQEAEQLRAIVARCQSLAAWLTRHSNLGVDVEADGIRRAIGDRLYVALGVPSPPAEWEQHGFPSVRGRCPACDGNSLFLGEGGYVTCRRLSCSEPDAASTLLGKHPRAAARAEVAVQRVRAECAAIGTPHICNAVDRILGVLDQLQERP